MLCRPAAARPAGYAGGLCIWRIVGAKKSDTVFFGNSDLKPLGIDRATKSRALRALEQAGLVKINRQQGRFPTVTLLCTGRSGKR
jgi:DNA-binding transcriptional ArsR family regulator